MRIRAHTLAVVQVAALLCSVLPGGAAEKKPLRLEEIFAEGGLTGRMPTQLRWSPDGRRLTYIVRKGERRDLWVMEAASGEKRVLVSHEQLTSLAPSPEQATTDERERERLLRAPFRAVVEAPVGEEEQD
ncbi:MAG: TolB family protein [Terriglobia bacterium]